MSLATSISDRIKYFEVLNCADDQEQTTNCAAIDDQCQTSVYKERYRAARNKEKLWRDLKKK